MQAQAHLIGRILLAIIFILAGIGKVMDPAGTTGYMSSMGIPAILLWPTVLLELGGGIALALGFKTRIISLLLAGFCIIAALVFHRNFADQMQMIMFLKNLAIAGGLLQLYCTGATAYALDKR